jgi:tRNA(Arg) A34 adenosine deaminase TadA
VYYPTELREVALNNDHLFHLTAWVRVGKSYIYGVNSYRCSTKFARRYEDGVVGYHLHAEMALLKKIEGLGLKTVNVARFNSLGELTMAKPCKYCQSFLKNSGIRKVRYSNWDGNWEVLKLK